MVKDIAGEVKAELNRRLDIIKFKLNNLFKMEETLALIMINPENVFNKAFLKRYAHKTPKKKEILQSVGKFTFLTEEECKNRP